MPSYTPKEALANKKVINEKLEKPRKSLLHCTKLENIGSWNYMLPTPP